VIVVAGVALTGWLGISTDLSPAAQESAEDRRAADESHIDRVSDRMAEAGFREVPGQVPPAAPAATVPDLAGPKILPTAPAVVAPAPGSAPPPAAPTPAKSKNEKVLAGETIPHVIAPDVDDADVEPAEPDEPDDAALARKTTVNVVCLRPVRGGTSVSSGSGVVISARGLVATNAHVARFFLLSENDVSCSVTHPSMPALGHAATLVYISPDWVRENADAPGGARASGTGEEDYAFVSIEPSVFTPEVFDYAPVDARDGVVREGDEVAIAGYPGAPRSLLDFGARLRFQVDRVDIVDVFSFGGGAPDILLTTETPVAAEGASGGGLFKNGKLVGLIATTIRGRRGESASALALSYINRDLRRDARTTIDELAEGDPLEAASSFASENAALRRLLESAL